MTRRRCTARPRRPRPAAARSCSPPRRCDPARARTRLACPRADHDPATPATTTATSLPILALRQALPFPPPSALRPPVVAAPNLEPLPTRGSVGASTHSRPPHCRSRTETWTPATQPLGPWCRTSTALLSWSDSHVPRWSAAQTHVGHGGALRRAHDGSPGPCVLTARLHAVSAVRAVRVFPIPSRGPSGSYLPARSANGWRRDDPEPSWRAPPRRCSVRSAGS